MVSGSARAFRHPVTGDVWSIVWPVAFWRASEMAPKAVLVLVGRIRRSLPAGAAGRAGAVGGGAGGPGWRDKRRRGERAASRARTSATRAGATGVLVGHRRPRARCADPAPRSPGLPADGRRMAEKVEELGRSTAARDTQPAGGASGCSPLRVLRGRGVRVNRNSTRGGVPQTTLTACHRVTTRTNRRQACRETPRAAALSRPRGARTAATTTKTRTTKALPRAMRPPRPEGSHGR